MLQFLRAVWNFFSYFKQSTSMWNLLCILKTKGLTKSKEKSTRITVPARHTVSVLPFAKLKPAVLTTEGHLQADLCYGEVSLTALLPPPTSAQSGPNAGDGQQLTANPHRELSRSQLCSLPLQSWRGSSC